MKRYLLFVFYCLSSITLIAQNTIEGSLQDQDNQAIIYANIIILNAADSTLTKVETTDIDGKFVVPGLSNGTYILKASYVGMDELQLNDIALSGNETKDIGALSLQPSSVELETAVITAQRAMVEVKADRTVFNVQGTINSTGDNALSLMRKAPGVLVDNNNNISVLSRSGVLLYIDGKRLPLSGDDLSNYLQSLPADQIDKIDIITNPGARYEAEGNAGIIDIRLKKDKSHGANGSVSGTYGIGTYPQGNVNVSGNYRNRLVNSFGTIGLLNNRMYNNIDFINYQNDIAVNEINHTINDANNYNFRLGSDFYVADGHILGFLVSGRYGTGSNTGYNRSEISAQNNITNIDSILVANNTNESDNVQGTYNINYRYINGDNSLNIDGDYGRFRNDSKSFQPNRYFSTEGEPLTEVISSFVTPRDIDIYTAKVDFETPLAGGKIGIGSKYSLVKTDNTFLFNDVIDGVAIQNNMRSNNFLYDESVIAGYVSYNRSLNDKITTSLGLRVENTDSKGDLKAFLPELQEDPVEQNYTNYFPTIGVSFQAAPMHAFSANYGRRINRPDYNVLNPFREQLSELSFSKGNANLKPEIVNNVELGYTYQYRYNMKLAYSRTTDQITRLIGPDESDPRAGFINWDNLAVQEIYSLNISAPITMSNVWDAYFNIGGSYKDNQATYPDGGVVDVQAWSYNLYMQHTFKMPKAFVGEISGWYSGPGVWGGVFEYDPSYSLNFGLQRKFLNDNMNVRLSVQDVFYETGWSGESNFNGLRSVGYGNWDSRRASISISYNFGNNNVKSNKRKTGIEDESKRVGS